MGDFSTEKKTVVVTGNATLTLIFICCFVRFGLSLDSFCEWHLLKWRKNCALLCRFRTFRQPHGERELGGGAGIGSDGHCQRRGSRDDAHSCGIRHSTKWSSRHLEQVQTQGTFISAFLSSSCVALLVDHPNVKRWCQIGPGIFWFTEWAKG